MLPRLVAWLCLSVWMMCEASSAAPARTGNLADGILGSADGMAWMPFGDPTFREIKTGGNVVWTIAAQTPGRQTGAYARASLPADSAALSVAADYKTEALVRGEKAWHSGRIRVDFLNDLGAKIGESYAIDRLEGTTPDWTPVSRQFPVPPGATRVNVALELFLARSGSIEFRDLTVRALDRQEADAWRAKADARIEEIRKADLAITVVDSTGRPVPDAQVHVRMRRHAYPFGTAIPAGRLLNTPANDSERNYIETFLAFFNYATFEGELKQRSLEKHGTQPAVDALKVLQAHGIQARGHVLVWPSWKMSAPSLVALKEQPDKVEAWICDHIRTTVGATKGLVVDWDVMNEPAVHHDIMDLVGKGKVADWYRLAHAIDPDVSLYLNENNVAFNGTNQESLGEWIDWLKAHGVPIDGAGWQGHMWQRTLPYGPSVLDDLDRFEKHGVKVQITEYDCNDRFGDDDEARFLADFLPAWFSHPSTAGFIMWGFWDGASWTNNAPLFNRDWSLKPAGKVWMDDVFGKWWSDADGVSDARGGFATRAFLGDYVVQVVHAGKVETVEAGLPKDGLVLKVALTDASPAWDDSHTLPDYNPYRSGKLPKVLKLPVPTAKPGASVIISTDEGEGADAAVGPSAPLGGDAALVAAGAPDMKSRSDLYLRFDLSKLVKGALAGAELVLEPGGELTAPFRARVYAMSDRFVPAAGELDDHWAESLISAGNAPGRDVAGGDYRIGDAALIYLGDWRASAVDGVVKWKSTELASAAGRALGKTLTLVIAPEDGVRAVFHSKEFSSSAAPRLTLQYEGP